MDQVYPFKITKAKPLTVNPRTAVAGVLELHIVRGPGTKGQAFLFKGAMNQEECEAALKGEIPSFLIGANSSAPSVVVYDGNQSEFTVATESEEAVIGYVRISESCNCK